MEKQTRESYPWADLEPLHHLFFPGRTMKGFKTTVYEAAKRHGFQLRCCEVAMGGETGVLVWRKK